MNKKLFTVAYCKYLVSTCTNRKLAWETILTIFETNDQELKDKTRELTGEIIIDGDWHRYNNHKNKIKRFTNSGSLYNALQKSDRILIWDKDNPDDKVSVIFHYLNNIELPEKA